MNSPSALRSLAMLTVFAALAACNAGQAEQRKADSESARPAATNLARVPVDAPASVDAPAATAATAAAATITAQPIVAQADQARSCTADADCAIKDVGSCCGYQPQCLNKDTPTFPEKVKEQCAREGRVSTCGMLAVSGCQCRSGKCENLLQSDESMAAPATPAALM